MEKEPQIKIIGGAPQKEKEDIQKIFYNRLFGEELLPSFSEEKKKEIRRLECPKSEEEERLIEFANKKTNKLMEEIGISPFDAPLTSFYILPNDLLKKTFGKNVAGGYSWDDRSVFLNVQGARQSLVSFAKLSFHELLHLKQFATLEAQEIPNKENIWITEFRGGLKIYSSQKKQGDGKKHTHFNGLNEAVVASQEKKYIEETLNLPALEQEKDWLNTTEAIEIKRNISRDKKVIEEDILWVSKDGKNLASVNYPLQREVFDFVCKEIQIKFPDKFESSADVQREFLKSFFSGRLLEIARLTEETFGKGSFRILGVMGIDDETPIQVMEILRGMKSRQKK